MATETRGTAKITTPADDQILITREFNAPKHLVYKVWTTPELVRRWWAGRQGEMKVVEIDLRVGGRWRYVLAAHGGGGEVAFHGTYREIVPNERIVTTEVFEMPDAPPESEAPLNIITFAEANGRTKLEFLVQCSNKELRDMILSSGMEAGVQGQLELVEELAISLL
jgi:uncharacterized protein YndB with AHSA1/START domain